MCWVPLIIDACLRMGLLGVIFGHSDNCDLADELLDDKYMLLSMFGDIICIFPFLLRAGYLRPQMIQPDQGVRVMLRLTELLCISRILRYTKDFPAIKAIRITLSRTAPHLVLPIFFFFSFNVFAAVTAYFIEPCYNTETCAWVDLFDASFYSVVTMTTTGYGDQVPYYLTTRMLAVVIMLFGALFISLPLAIIGNEYDEAWNEVREQTDHLSALKGSVAPSELSELGDSPEVEGRKSSTSFALTKKKSAMTSIPEEDNSGRDSAGSVSDVVEEKSDAIVEENFRVTDFSDDDSDDEGGVSSCQSQIQTLMSKIQDSFEKSRSLSPSLLLHFCELRGWLCSMKWQVQKSVRAALALKRYAASIVKTTQSSATKLPKANVTPNKRRLSVLRKIDVQVQPLEIESATSEVSIDESAILTRGDSILEDAKRIRGLSDFEESDLDYEETRVDSVDDVESGTVSETIRDAGGTDSANADRRTSSWNFVREFGTMFRKELEVVSTIDKEQPKRRVQGRTILMMLAKASKDVNPGGSHSLDFTKKMVRAARNPRSLRSRIWMLLELPSSSRAARGLRYVLLSLIVLSVFVIYTQTLTSLSVYGESTDICGKVLQLYCHDKHDPLLDPGCYNQNVDFVQRLDFFKCSVDTDKNCFRSGLNFGSKATNLTCSHRPGSINPFRTQSELILEYGAPNVANSRDDSHSIYSICNRVECSDTIGSTSGSGNKFWIPLEIVMNSVFTIELVLRIAVAESYKDFVFDFMNIFDIFSIVPFYVELTSAGSSSGLDFAILASSPEPLILVSMKSLKVSTFY